MGIKAEGRAVSVRRKMTECVLFSQSGAPHQLSNTEELFYALESEEWMWVNHSSGILLTIQRNNGMQALGVNDLVPGIYGAFGLFKCVDGATTSLTIDEAMEEIEHLKWFMRALQ